MITAKQTAEAEMKGAEEAVKRADEAFAAAKDADVAADEELKGVVGKFGSVWMQHADHIDVFIKDDSTVGFHVITPDPADTPLDADDPTPEPMPTPTP